MFNHKLNIVFLLFGLLLFATFVFADDNNDNLNVLLQDFTRPQSEEMMRRHIRRLTDEAFQRRLSKYESLKTVEQIIEHQQAMRQFFLSKLDLPTQKSALNSQIIDRKTYADYRIEKIIYESQPGFYVPALIYLPLSDPPYPGVLLLCGHDETGKTAYQRVGIMMAKNGVAVLCPDPIGQGERKQVLDENGKGIYRATGEHMICGIAPILLGRSLATYMIWDGIRGIDYLQSRPEIDPTRIGCTGNSGGGNRTSYLMALDERVVAAAPACFITTTRLKNDGKGPGDAEQNIHGQLEYGMDLPDYIIMRAPKPTLILSATRDFVPIEGAWNAFRQAKRIYTRFGFAEGVDIVEADETHGFSKHLRIGAVRWMQRWLLDVDDVITEEECAILSHEELQCTPDGQVLLIPGARSIFDLNIEKAKQFVDKRKLFWCQSTNDKIRGKIRELTGIRRSDDLPTVTSENTGVIQRPGYQIHKLSLKWDTDIILPALLFQPEKLSGEKYLYLHGNGKHVDAGPNGAIEKFVRSGHIVMAVDLRGIGETQTIPWRYQHAHEFTGSDVAEYFIAYMLNKSFLGMRAEDILVSAKFLTHLKPSDNHRRIHLVAIGETGPSALHAMALEPQLFESLSLQKSLVSWLSVVHTPVTRGALNNVVHGVLCSYDLPDLISLIGKQQIHIKEPVDALGKVVSK